jgi:hypothetical protein
MSYLDTPRVHFGGKFFTDPSTVNNDPTHYESKTTEPSPWQNPYGQHRFSLRNCLIKSAIGSDGETFDDPVIGCALTTTDKPSAAKIVDLDVYQQGVPTIYGMQFKLAISNDVFIIGTLDPTVLNQMWTNSVLPTRSWGPDDYAKNSFGGDMYMCGWFHSVLRVKTSDWPEITSPILKQLKESTLVKDGDFLVSLKFTLDGYQNVPENKDFQTGRIVGTLGPVFANEPLYNLGHRFMLPKLFSENSKWNSPSFNDCLFKVDTIRKKLILDLSNSICRIVAGGAPVDLGTLKAVVSTPEPVDLELGTVDYSEFCYDSKAHIVELDLNDTQLAVLQENPLSLVSSKIDLDTNRVLFEKIDKIEISAEIRPIRLSGTIGTTGSTRVAIRHKGIPLANKQLAIKVISVHGTTPGATVPKSNPGNTPQAEGALEASISISDVNGFATVTLNVMKDPGRRTDELDGQLYFIVVYDLNDEDLDWKHSPPQKQTISCLVWSTHIVNESPSWIEIVDILAPYMKLFPYMKDLMDVTDSHTFEIFSRNPPWAAIAPGTPPGPFGINAGTLPFYMSRDFNDTRFMPVTRDLSPEKIMTIMHFIKNLQDTTP